MQMYIHKIYIYICISDIWSYLVPNNLFFRSPTDMRGSEPGVPGMKLVVIRFQMRPGSTHQPMSLDGIAIQWDRSNGSKSSSKRRWCQGNGHPARDKRVEHPRYFGDDMLKHVKKTTSINYITDLIGSNFSFGIPKYIKIQLLHWLEFGKILCAAFLLCDLVVTILETMVLNLPYPIWGFRSHGGTPKWMGCKGNSIYKWMI